MKNTRHEPRCERCENSRTNIHTHEILMDRICTRQRRRNNKAHGVRPHRASAIKNEISARSSKNTDVISPIKLYFARTHTTECLMPRSLFPDIWCTTSSRFRHRLAVLCFYSHPTILTAHGVCVTIYMRRRRTRIISADVFFMTLLCACLYLFSFSFFLSLSVLLLMMAIARITFQRIECVVMCYLHLPSRKMNDR